MSVLGGLDRQLNVVHALALRETRTRFGGHRLGYFWAYAEPLLWIVTFFLIFSVADRESPRGMTLFPFLTTGLITYELFAKTTDKVAEAINGNRALLYYPQVRPLDVTFARGALEAATYVSVFAVLMLADSLVSGKPLYVADPLSVLLGLGLAALLGYAFGLVFCMAQVVSETVKRLRGPLLRPLFWISGLFFTANALPLHVRNVVLVNPVLHCIEIVRGGWFGSYEARHASALYVTSWIVGLLFVGMTFERVVRRRVEVT
jgi:capsular polysaccharide transport system permease protein